MNTILQNFWSGFEMYQALRNQLVAQLTDADLAYRLPGDNPTLGDLLLDIGQTQTAYIASFKTLTLNFNYRHPDPTIATSVTRLRDWFTDLDRQLKAVIAGLSQDDVDTKVVDRGGDFKLPLPINLYVYQEALLIFYGKASCYLKALQKDRTEQWRDWIG
jgi:hypothetical protein